MRGAKDSARNSNNALDVGFVHLDLGIGGAERVIVDAAVALQQVRPRHLAVAVSVAMDVSDCGDALRVATM